KVETAGSNPAGVTTDSRGRMEARGFRDLVGRIMTDPDFLAELVRDPAAALADYTLSADEHNLVLQAVGREGQVPTAERLRAVKTWMWRRWPVWGGDRGRGQAGRHRLPPSGRSPAGSGRRTAHCPLAPPARAPAPQGRSTVP